jgi:hypothetical protein
LGPSIWLINGQYHYWLYCTGIAGLRQINVVGTMADVPDPFEPLKVSLALRKKVITSHLVAEQKYCITELSIHD